RKAYGDALAALGAARGDVVALDGEVSNSTYADIFAKAHPERYFEMFIAEQQMVAAAVGMQVLGWRPFASTFAAFLSRAYDFIRMSAISRASYCLCGSHAGISIGEDGPSQMGLEDISALRAVHGSTVLHPCDANQTARLVEEHLPEGGLGEAVLSALADAEERPRVVQLAVREAPRSGKPAELLAAAGIDADAIAAAARKLVEARTASI